MNEHGAEKDVPPTAVPDARTGRWLVKWCGITFSLTPEEWETFRAVATYPRPPAEPAFVDGDKVLDDLTDFLSETRDTPPAGGHDA